jgi:hypothetical protein
MACSFSVQCFNLVTWCLCVVCAPDGLFTISAMAAVAGLNFWCLCVHLKACSTSQRWFLATRLQWCIWSQHHAAIKCFI